MKRRYRIFRINSEWVDGHPQLVKKFMRDMLVIRAEWLYAENAVEYVAQADWFEEVPKNCVALTWEVQPVCRQIKFGRFKGDRVLVRLEFREETIISP